MFGKHFSNMYDGSLYGAGSNVFAVWGYCIANADAGDHTVLLNPKKLASTLGDTEKSVKEAIEFLCSPDTNSKCPLEEGRRLIHQSGYLYFMVTHEAYREMKNNEDRREYMRLYMRDYRAKGKGVNKKANKVFTKANPVSVSVSASKGRNNTGLVMTDEGVGF